MSGSENESEVYEVEAIRAWRYSLDDRRREFFVKWENWPENTNTWEPEEHLNCPFIFRKFVDNLSADRRKLFDLAKDSPDSLNGFQRNAKFKAFVGATRSHKVSKLSSDSETTAAAEGQQTKSKKSGKQEAKGEIHILVKFDDTDKPEQVSVDELYNERPEELLRYFEKRILLDSGLEN